MTVQLIVILIVKYILHEMQQRIGCLTLAQILVDKAAGGKACCQHEQKQVLQTGSHHYPLYDLS